jgi:saccharopine dehydrogenase (NAD+, L-lysine-forming)
MYRFLQVLPRAASLFVKDLRHFCEIMIRIGLLKEGKIPPDNRVALTPEQCKALQKINPDIKMLVQSSASRCYSDREYEKAGVEVTEDIRDCDILFGIKEVPPASLIENKTYLFFSHTRKKQLYNQKLLQTILKKNITLIDYECMEHEDGQRIIGFGFFAGVVGAHNGIMAYGKRTSLFHLPRVYQQKNFKELIHSYFGLKLPNIKIAVTGSGRVAHGIVEIMNLMEVIELEKEEFLSREYSYPVYVQLKGSDLYRHKVKGTYNRVDFHTNAQEYECLFDQYIPHTDILMNGIFWDVNVPKLFERERISDPDFRIKVIADITDDAFGSVPINLGDQSIEDPVYGVDRSTFKKTAPYQANSVDIMAVGNLPNELPRDASKYFGEQLMKYILPDLLSKGSRVISDATIVRKGQLTEKFEYLHDYAEGKTA